MQILDSQAKLEMRQNTTLLKKPLISLPYSWQMSVLVHQQRSNSHQYLGRIAGRRREDERLELIYTIYNYATVPKSDKLKI